MSERFEKIGICTFLTKILGSQINTVNFKIHPSGEFLIVAFQDSGKLEMYRIDLPSGLLVGEPQVVACPNSPTIVGLLEL